MRRDLEKAKDFASRHNVPKFYHDAQQLIDDPEVNAVYIATPPAQHEEYLVKALQAGKPVYVEKPVSIDAASCQRMSETSKEYDLPVSVAHYRRGLPLFKKVKSLLEAKTLGAIRLVLINTLQNKSGTSAAWRVNPELSGGGHFHDLSPHQLDLMYWFFGKPQEVNGRSLNQGKHYNAPDLTSLEILFDHSVFFRGVWSFSVDDSAEADTCEIIGEKGVLKFSFFKGATLEYRSATGTEVIEFTNPVNIQHPMIENVVKYFRGEGENPCSLDDALVVMKLIDSTV
jgi:1,5-anhydro-D-fructose reductase (1,5-anhydro-D-mannitol-forming)